MRKALPKYKGVEERKNIRNGIHSGTVAAECDVFSSVTAMVSADFVLESIPRHQRD
jgi:hypothetical protein